MANRLHIYASSSLVALMVAAAPAHARTEITPWIELDQTVTADLKPGDEVLTYSSIAAGIDVTVESGRTQAQLSYNYEYRYGWGDKLGNDDVHSGLARVAHELVPGKVNIEAGALATRARSDNRGDAPAFLVGNEDNITQVYSVYAGPTFRHEVGPVEMNAAYRLGYTKVEDNAYTPAPGEPRVDGYDDSVAHLAMASVGMSPGALPFGWSVSGAWEREDAGQLDQRFESMGVRGDVVVPITRTVALVGGVGYEDIEASERAALLDAGGNPVVDGNGRFVTDPTSPRLASYDFDGIYWDVGAEWKPSSRTQLGVHVGKRYGSMSYTGGFSWATDDRSSLSLTVYDTVETFGQQLTDGLARLPTSFNSASNNLAPQFNSCTFGGDGGRGGCISPAFQGVSSSVFRTRGVTGYYGTTRGRMTAGLGIGYSERLYKTPVIAGAFTLDGIKDKSYFGQGNLGYQLGAHTGLDTSIFASKSQSGIAGSPDVFSTGITSGLYHNFGRRLSARAALGLYSYEIDGEAQNVTASGQVGMRYSF